MLIETLNKFLDESNVGKMLIFLHPLEKSKKEHLDYCVKYYRDLFGDKIDFAPLDAPSRLQFAMASIGISVYSTLQTERLYGGYKTLFAPMGYLKNFFQEDRFENISIQNYDDLKRLVDATSKMSADEFFKNYDLEEYRWPHFGIDV
jgi:hypothetical protein